MMAKISAAQSHVYTLLDKLEPVSVIIMQKDEEWEQCGLEDLMDILKRYVEKPVGWQQMINCKMDVPTTMGSLKEVTETWKSLTHFCWQNNLSKATTSDQHVCTAIWAIIDLLNAWYS